MAHGRLQLAVLCVACLMWGGCQPAAPRNVGVVQPGVLYRSGQPTPAGLEKVVAEHGTRTVVSLRPVRDADGSPDTWEEELCSRLGVRHVRIAPDDAHGDAWLGRMARGSSRSWTSRRTGPSSFTASPGGIAPGRCARSSGSGRRITPVMRNGTTPTQDVPPYSWTVSPSGTSRRISATGTGQRANYRSCQFCRNTHLPTGIGQEW